MNKSAKVVRDYIRKTVPRPKELPIRDRVCNGYYRWENIGGSCPMGLLREAKWPIPNSLEAFKKNIFTVDQIKDFANWWDALKCSPQKAVELVWGTKK